MNCSILFTLYNLPDVAANSSASHVIHQRIYARIEEGQSAQKRQNDFKKRQVLGDVQA